MTSGEPRSGEGPPPLVLRLYVAGDAPNSTHAHANLLAILGSGDESPAYQLEVVDCIREPLRAHQDGVIVTPTLVKVAPGPPQTIIGNLRDTVRVREALGIANHGHD